MVFWKTMKQKVRIVLLQTGLGLKRYRLALIPYTQILGCRKKKVGVADMLSRSVQCYRLSLPAEGAIRQKRYMNRNALHMLAGAYTPPSPASKYSGLLKKLRRAYPVVRFQLARATNCMSLNNN